MSKEDLIKVRSALRVMSSLRFPDTVYSAPRTDVLTFSHDADRADLLDGKAYGRILGSIEDILESDGLSVTRVAHPYSQLVGTRAWGEPLSMNRSAFKSALRRRFFRSRGDADFDCEASYRKLLLLTWPKVILCIGAPTELCRVARENRIVLIEVLHGRGYSKVPWGWETREASELPAGVLSFDPVSTGTFGALLDRGVKVWEVSDPWLSRFEPGNQHLLPDEWKKNSTKKAPSKTVILVSLQWGYAGDHGDQLEYQGILSNGLIPRALLRAMEDTGCSIDWLLRLHPVQRTGPLFKKHRGFLDKLSATCPNVEWEWASSAPLPVVLSAITHHVTMSSMTAYEAADAGVPSLLLCPTLDTGGAYESMFADLVDQGIAQKRNHQQPEIIEWINSAHRMQRKQVLDRNEFSTSEFLAQFDIPKATPQYGEDPK